MDELKLKNKLSFWKWWFKYGIIGYCNRWLIPHLIIAAFLGYFVPMPINEVSQLVIIPLSGVLIGLSFAWIGNAMALIESNEIKELMDKHKNGKQEYIFTYQSTILIILITIVGWALVGLKLHKIIFFNETPPILKVVFKGILFFVTNLAIRDCWNIVMSVQWFLITKMEIKEMKFKKSQLSKDTVEN